MAVISRVTTWSDGQTLTASALNGEFNNIINDYNGGITNANISSGAAISYSKLALTGAILSADLAGSIAATKITGTAAVLSGNTFTGKNTFTNTVQTISSYTPTGGGTATLNLSSGNFHFITMPAGNATIALSNETVGQAFLVRILQDSGGSRTVTWFTTIKWAGGSAPTLTTTASKADVFGFIVTSAGNYDGFVVGQGL